MYFFSFRRCRIILLILIVSSIQTINAQVTIGSTIKPVQGALLDLKENDSKGANSSKGLILPRVKLEQRKSLNPIPNASSDEKYTGLIVYNVGEEVTESYENQLCKGMHTWDGEKWQPTIPYPKWEEGINSVSCNEPIEYSLVCSSTKVYGEYRKNTSLDNSHYIEVEISAPANLIGKKYYLESYTNKKYGITFRTQGVIESTSQLVKMQGIGTLTTNIPFEVKIVSNSNAQDNSCATHIDVIMPKIRIAGVGNPNYHPASEVSLSKSYVLMSNPKTFGTDSDSKVKTDGFIFENYSDRNTAQWKALFESKPDIIIRAYLSHMNDDMGSELKKYLDAGGIFIDFNDNNGRSNAGVRALYGSTASSNKHSGDPGQLMEFNAIDDEIMNGVWGDIRGKHWAEDASYTQGISGVPTDKITIYSRSNTGTQNITMFRDKQVNYIYIGDGGFLSGAAASNGCCFPFQLDSNNMPTPAYGGVRYNSTFFANLITWATKQAVSNGINEY